MNDMPKYKRQRIDYEYIEKENFNSIHASKQYAQVPYEVNCSNKFLISSKQELGHIDELFNWLDEENIESNNDMSIFNVHYDAFGFLTPTMTEMNFF